jgi:hypothetical protein
VLEVYSLQRTLVGLVGREGGSREVRRRQRPRRDRPSVGVGKAAKREDELGREGSR